MPLWNTKDTNTDGAKPKFAKPGSPINPDNVAATNRGWELLQPSYVDCNGNTRARREVLVAIGNLDGGTSANTNLGSATITAAKFRSATITKGNLLNLDIVYNEKVTVTGTPTYTVGAANTTSAAVPTTLSLSYHSGSGTNKLTFRATSFSNAASYTLTSGSIANTSALQIVDVGTTVAADLTIPAAYTGANSAIGVVIAS